MQDDAACFDSSGWDGREHGSIVAVFASAGTTSNRKTVSKTVLKNNKLCTWRHNMPRPSSPPVGAQAPRAPPRSRKVALLSHAEYVPMLTTAAALRVKAALSKAACDLDLWTLKVISKSCVTWAICTNFGLPRPLCSQLRPDVRDRQTSDRCQTKSIA